MEAMLRKSLAAAAILVACVSAASYAQGADTLPKLQLGEGTWQPNGRPLAIPDVVPKAPINRSGLPLSTRLVRSVMTRNPQTHRRWDYTGGVVLHAIEEVALAHHDTAMLSYVNRNMERWIEPTGNIQGYSVTDYNLDNVAQGRLLFGLYSRTHNARYRKAADLLRSQLRTQPRTSEGGFWHKKIYPEQMWLDGIYMGEPFYAQYARDFNDPAAFDDIARQILLMDRHTRDPRTNLMVHAWDAAHKQQWADSVTGQSKSFWGRSMGWYMLGLIDVLDYFPRNHSARAAMIASLQQAADGVARVQDPVTGLWWNVLDQPNRAGNYLEGSTSSIFAYVFAKGARLGYLTPRYRALASRALDGIQANLLRENSNGTLSLINIHQSAGLGGAPRKDGTYRDGSFAYYIGEPVVTDDYKGVGPLILAALELNR
jgi:unsaturated rhamnogalacturonyl hydrolase